MSLSTRIFSEAFRDMQRAMAAMEQPLLNASAVTPSFFNRAGIRSPTTDMVETKNSFELHAEVPGFDKNDIKVEVPNSHTVVLKGKVDKEHKAEPPSSPSPSDTAAASEDSATEKTDNQQVTTTTANKDKQVSNTANDGRQCWVQERVSGSFFRSFQLPITVDPETIKASYNNGVLKVVISKVEGKGSTQINID
jgi:HSP20 family molecular chaperone IbpA